ncbi:hypothetical protein PUN28_010742 [Cardiocondyla obscurior]|uniref:Uncharacterized protein n=1 Tax=Cardiocondyla obscurior TaxID=286306 RepID=A0AAW2FM18_9HYME
MERKRELRRQAPHLNVYAVVLRRNTFSICRRNVHAVQTANSIREAAPTPLSLPPPPPFSPARSPRRRSFISVISEKWRGINAATAFIRRDGLSILGRRSVTARRSARITARSASFNYFCLARTHVQLRGPLAPLTARFPGEDRLSVLRDESVKGGRRREGLSGFFRG